MRYLLICLAVAGCATQPAPAPVVVKDCTWTSRLAPFTFSSQDTAKTKREMIALTQAYNSNCK